MPRFRRMEDRRQPFDHGSDCQRQYDASVQWTGRHLAASFSCLSDVKNAGEGVKTFSGP